jgi:hypothetical protein
MLEAGSPITVAPPASEPAQSWSDDLKNAENVKIPTIRGHARCRDIIRVKQKSAQSNVHCNLALLLMRR